MLFAIRSGEKAIFVVPRSLISCTPVSQLSHVFHEMLDFIMAEGYVRVPIQPRGDLYTSGKLDAHSVAILYIGSEGLTDLADLGWSGSIGCCNP